jgi:peptidoglycan/xylan/chitin deacetylase (PgdA/CDA1 family)
VPVRIALTIDTEHPDQGNCPPESCDRILDHLRDARVRATFFVQGRWALANPDRVRRIADEGHLVANHSHFHFPASRLTPESLATDITEAEEAITRLTGRNPRPWFRLPFFNGQSVPWVRATIRELGYVAVGSNVDSGDWDAQTTPEMLTRALVSGAREHDPAVVTLHSWPAATAPGLRDAVGALTHTGASFVTVDELSPSELAACDPSAPASVNTALG